MSEKSYAGKLKDSLYWWLGKRRPFFINGEYKIELLHIVSNPELNHYSAKIRITNLKNGMIEEREATHDGSTTC